MALKIKLKKKTSLQTNEKTYTFTQRELDELIYRVQSEAKIAATRQIVRHMIRIGALIITDNMGAIYRPVENRLATWLGYCCHYVTEYKSLIPTGRLKEIEDLLIKASPEWEEKI